MFLGVNIYIYIYIYINIEAKGFHKAVMVAREDASVCIETLKKVEIKLSI